MPWWSRPEQWGKFAQKLHLLEALTRDPLSMAPKEAPKTLGHLAAAIQQGLRQEWRPTQLPVIRSLLSTSSRTSSFGNGSGLGRSAPWLPFDIYMESVLERRRLSVTSNTDTLAGLCTPFQEILILYLSEWLLSPCIPHYGNGIASRLTGWVAACRCDEGSSVSPWCKLGWCIPRSLDCSLAFSVSGMYVWSTLWVQGGDL